MNGLTNCGLHAETLEEAINRLQALGKIDIHTRNELLAVWKQERYYAEKDACNRREIFKALDAAEAALNAIETKENEKCPLLPSNRIKKERLMLTNARIAGYRNCDRFDDAVEMRKAYFAYQNNIIKANIPDAEPVMYDVWMLGIADDIGDK